MTASLVALCVVLTVLTILNMLLCFAVLRRLRGAGSDTVSNDLPEIGRVVGDFAATDLHGEQLDRGAVSSAVVALLTPGCEPCQTVADQLRATPPTGDVIAFVVGEQDEDTLDFARGLTGVARVAVASTPGDGFGPIVGYPTLVRVQDGVIVAAGRRLPEVVETAPSLVGSAR